MTKVYIPNEMALVRLDELDMGMTFYHKGRHYQSVWSAIKFLDEGLRLVMDLADYRVFTMDGAIEVVPTKAKMYIDFVDENGDERVKDEYKEL